MIPNGLLRLIAVAQQDLDRAEEEHQASTDAGASTQDLELYRNRRRDYLAGLLQAKAALEETDFTPGGSMGTEATMQPAPQPVKPGLATAKPTTATTAAKPASQTVSSVKPTQGSPSRA